MPKNRPGNIKYVTATKAVDHDMPIIENFAAGRPGIKGTAIKQKAPGSGAAAGTPQKQIAIAEACAVVTKGQVEVPNVTGAVKGDPVWINVTNNALTLTDPGAGNGRKFGIVSEIPSERGGRSTHMRVDLEGTF